MIRRAIVAAVVLGALSAGGWFAWTQSQLVRAPGGPWHFDGAEWTQSRDHWRLDVSLSVQTASDGVASAHFKEFDPEFAICEAMLTRLPDAPEGVGAGDIYEVGVFLVALDADGYPARNSSIPVPVMVDNGRCIDRGEGGVFYYNFAPPLSGWLWNGGVGWESSGDEDPIWVIKVFKSVPLFETVEPFDPELACEDLLGDPRYTDRLPGVPQADTVPMDQFRIEWSPEDGMATGNIIGFATMDTQIMAVDGADCTPVDPS